RGGGGLSRRFIVLRPFLGRLRFRARRELTETPQDLLLLTALRDGLCVRIMFGYPYVGVVGCRVFPFLFDLIQAVLNEEPELLNGKFRVTGEVKQDGLAITPSIAMPKLFGGLNSRISLL